MPIETMKIIKENAEKCGLSPAMTARSVLCEHFKRKKALTL